MIGAALAGTLVLHGVDTLERRLLGRPPVYDVRAMGKRLFGNPRAGVALRWAYGTSLALIQRRLGIPALLFGPAVAAAELLAMPRVGATPPPRTWRRGEVPLLFAHATAFALAVSAAGRFARFARAR